MKGIQFYLTVLVVVFGITTATSQIKVIKNQEKVHVGEFTDFQGAIISLSYSKKGKKRLYKLRSKSAKEVFEIEFYATKSEINDLYKLIYDDFGKPPEEFSSEVLLGNNLVTIRTDWFSHLANRNSGSSYEHVLSVTIKNKGSFNINKAQLQSLFGF